MRKLGLCLLLLFGGCSVSQPTQATTSPRDEKSTQPEMASDEAVQRSAAEALGEREGAVLVIDPQTGRLRAVVNPRLAFEQSFPPGSAIKPFTTLAALRAGLLDPETRRQCQTRYARGDFQIVCSHPRSNSPFNLTQALAYSCNDYYAHVGERLSEGAFNSTLRGFGFGERTGATAGEVAGRLPRGEWRVQTALGDDEKLLVTPVQLLTAFAALVNGGHLFRPQQSDDAAFSPAETARLGIAPAHRKVLIEGMRGAVKYGTAEKANLGGLPFFTFGKTGTSTASNGFRTQGWFVGFAAETPPTGVPAPEQIKLGVLVFLKRAHGAQAAEVAKDVLNCGLRIADCGLKAPRLSTGSSFRPPSESTGPLPLPAFAHPQSKGPPVRATGSSGRGDRNPQSIRVRSISENKTRELPLEEYLVGVLAGEASIENQPEALKAQAVISRTFALRNIGRHSREGYDFCSTTHCQRFVVPNYRLHASARRNVAATHGEVLQDRGGGPIDAYFHAACGGVTANIETLWGVPAPAYLRGVRDDFCATRPHRRWEQTIPAGDLARALQTDDRTDVGGRLKNITVSKRDATGRAETVTLEGQRSRTVRGWDFKIIVGRSLGWQMVKSSRFEVSRSGDGFVFRGSGFGHGLGLCQEGSHAMAARRMGYRHILSFYFPGARLSRAQMAGLLDPGEQAIQLAISHSPLSIIGQGEKISLCGIPEAVRKIEKGEWSPGFSLLASQSALAESSRLKPEPLALLSGSAIYTEQQGTLASEHFRASFGGGNDRQQVERALRVLEAARNDLLRRLRQASLRLNETEPFEVVIHGTTADFIKSTGLSGLATGAARGRRIELQPLKLLERRGVLTTTLRHELTHSVIELIGGGNVPRWLAEGLALHVAGEGGAMERVKLKTRLSTDQLELKLARHAQAAEMREYYAMAWREVQSLIKQKGEAHMWQLVAKSKEKAKVG